ncbi:cytoplasmic protein [Lentinula raphanica]|nr:cytoplasmic protein [Lentinula raphanica]
MSTYSDFSDVHTNLARPKTSATLTVRVIKSFQYRTERSLVLQNINLETTTVGQLKDISRQAIQSQSGWKPYRNVELDTMKLYSQAHGAKVKDIPRKDIYNLIPSQTTNLIINLDHDEWILTDDSKTLAEAGFENETEVSFFNRNLYEQFKENPEV